MCVLKELRLSGVVTDYLLRLTGRVPLKLAALAGGRRGIWGLPAKPPNRGHTTTKHRDDSQRFGAQAVV